MNRCRHPHRDVSDDPDPEVVLRIAELIAPLPLASARALARVRAVSLPLDGDGDDHGEALRGTWAWRELDWLPLYAHFGRTRGWLAARVRALSAAELLALLECDLGRIGQRDAGPPVGEEGGRERGKE